MKRWPYSITLNYRFFSFFCWDYFLQLSFFLLFFIVFFQHFFSSHFFNWVIVCTFIWLYYGFTSHLPIIFINLAFRTICYFYSFIVDIRSLHSIALLIWHFYSTTIFTNLIFLFIRHFNFFHAFLFSPSVLHSVVILTV